MYRIQDDEYDYDTLEAALAEADDGAPIWKLVGYAKHDVTLEPVQEADELPGPPVVASGPDWSKAPTWAKFHAYDCDGKGCWYSERASGPGRRSPNWAETLTERPVLDWSKAPEWAKYHAVDEDGRGWWFSHRPSIKYDFWTTGLGQWVRDDLPIVPPEDFKKTLTKRPK